MMSTQASGPDELLLGLVEYAIAYYRGEELRNDPKVIDVEAVVVDTRKAPR